MSEALPKEVAAAIDALEGAAFDQGDLYDVQGAAYEAAYQERLRARGVLDAALAASLSASEARAKELETDLRTRDEQLTQARRETRDVEIALGRMKVAREEDVDAAEVRGMQAIAPGWRARAEAAEARAHAAEEHSRGLESALQIMGEENAKLERERDEARSFAQALEVRIETLKGMHATAEARREEAERERDRHLDAECRMAVEAGRNERWARWWKLAAQANRAERDEARRALRAVFPAGSWCAYCGQGIDEAEGHPCHQCSAARRVLSGAGAEEGRHTAASHPGEERR
jgi:DNA repair exonuclease SbcCD ATPase subunit